MNNFRAGLSLLAGLALTGAAAMPSLSQPSAESFAFAGKFSLAEAMGSAQLIIGKKRSQDELNRRLIESVGNAAQTRALLKAGANPNAVAPDGDTVLMIAVENAGNEELDTIEALIAAKADVNAENPNGDTALMKASEEDDIDIWATDIVQDLLNARAHVNAADKEGVTALMLAACNDRSVTTAMLLKAGASVNVMDKNGMTALSCARWRGGGDTISLLKKAGAR